MLVQNIGTTGPGADSLKDQRNADACASNDRFAAENGGDGNDMVKHFWTPAIVPA